MKSRIVLALMWTILVIALSSMPGSAVREFSFTDLAGADKLGHMGMYGLLTFFWSRVTQLKTTSRFFWKYPAICATLLGIGLEYCQLFFFSERSFEAGDMVANALGVLVSMVYFWFFEKKADYL